MRLCLLIALLGQLPAISGHLTAPGPQLTTVEKLEIQSSLAAVQQETHVDVAIYLIPDPLEDRQQNLAARLHAHWNIGKDHSGGLLLVISSDGRRCEAQQSGPRTPYSPEFVKLLQRRAERPPLATALKGIAERCRRIGGTIPRSRPPLVARPNRQEFILYTTAWFLSLALAATSIRFGLARQP